MTSTKSPIFVDMEFRKNVASGSKCAHLKTVKNGKDQNGRQRYKCKVCGETFTDESNSNLELRRKKRITTQLLLLGYTSNQIETVIPVKESEIDSWRKKYLPKLEDITRSGKLIKVNHAYKYLSALDRGKRPKKRINKNKPPSRRLKHGAKTSTRKKP